MTNGPFDEEADLRNLWEENAQKWVRGVRSGYDRFRRSFHDPVFYGLLGEVFGLNIVDLGCGEGITCRELAARGAQSVTGVDISPAMIEAAHSQPLKGSTIAEYFVASISDATILPSNHFDRAVSVMTLMDLPDLQGAMQTAKRVLTPGGIFVFSISHPFWDRRETEWECSSSREWQVKPGNYFDTEDWVDRWGFSRPDGTLAEEAPFLIRTYPRTIADYLNTAIEAGLELHVLAEPQPPSSANMEFEATFQRWRRAPFYLMARLSA